MTTNALVDVELELESGLTGDEWDELERCEAIIERGLQTFVEVGNALLAIRDGRLYRETYRTFEDYCRERWDMERAHAYRLMAASEVVKNLSPIGDILPANEAQARVLASLPTEAQQEVWVRALDIARGSGKKVTAEHVKQAATTYPMQEEQFHRPDRMAVHYSSKTDEHLTPQNVLDAVLVCLGEIDLDPCSNSREKPNVPAGRHFTREDDGLAQEWHGRVYMNSPHGTALPKWVKKLLGEYEAGRVSEAIALVPSRTNTQWWVELRDHTVCLFEGQLKFDDASKSSVPFPSAAFYLGPNVERFYRAFYHLGDIWRRVEFDD